MNLEKVFISWLPFQRRTETVAKTCDLELRYFHFKWEEKHKGLKALSYLLKFIETIIYLFRKRPAIVFVQLAPTPPLYALAFCKIFFNFAYVADCHNTMIYDGHWIHWPFAKTLLKKADLVLVHNPEVQQKARSIGIDSFVYMDPPPAITINSAINTIAGIRIKEEDYVLLPSNMGADDEPAEEFFNAARLLPDICFVLTGYAEKVPAHIRKLAPANVKYTGYLREDEFNALYKNASMALVLSTREGTQPSGASEAISIGVPLIVTDLETTRKIYQDTVIFTRNKTEDLVSCIPAVLEKRDWHRQQIIKTKKIVAGQTDRQFQDLVRLIGSFKVPAIKESLSNA